MNMHNSDVYPIDKYGALFDAHIHTYFDYHDGQISPQGLIHATLRKRFNWVLAMAHDTVRGHKRIEKLAKEAQLPCITGIEVSTPHNHILAYGIKEWPYRRVTIDPEYIGIMPFLRQTYWNFTNDLFGHRSFSYFL